MARFRVSYDINAPGLEIVPVVMNFFQFFWDGLRGTFNGRWGA
jgi:hypothetical protein